MDVKCYYLSGKSLDINNDIAEEDINGAKRLLNISIC
jgi:hypothetical protein